MEILRFLPPRKEQQPPSQTAVFFHNQGDLIRCICKDEKDPTVHALWEETDRILGYNLSETCRGKQAGNLLPPEYAQPALFITQEHARKSLKDPPAAPVLYGGHGHPEQLNAAVAAGAIDFADGLILAQAYGRGIKRASEVNPGRMLQVKTPPSQIKDVITEPLVICALNSIGETVLGGPTPNIDGAKRQLKKQGYSPTILKTPRVALYSKYMEPALPYLEEALGNVSIRAAQVPIISCLTGKPIKSPDEIQEELRGILTQPLNMPAVFQTFENQGITQFVVVGDKNATNIKWKIFAGVAAATLGTLTVGTATLWYLKHRKSTS